MILSDNRDMVRQSYHCGRCESLQAALARKDRAIRALAVLVERYATCPAEWGEDGSPATCKAADDTDLCDSDGTDCWMRWAEAEAENNASSGG